MAPPDGGLHMTLTAVDDIWSSDITGYGRIAMVFVFSPYIRKLTSCFQFQVNFTFNDFTAQIMLKIICVPNFTLNYHFLSKL